jgi:hypothetical protein
MMMSLVACEIAVADSRFVQCIAEALKIAACAFYQFF